jgi:2-keto-4-pentenoate hydratase/2-oxohepta-3-ene-1,7-dioic acid hydratase in catechol pathway
MTAYKLLTYRAGNDARAGILVGDTVYDAQKATGETGHAAVLAILGDWTRAQKALAQAASRIASGKSRVKGAPLKKTKLCAPVLYPGEIFCAGANYTDHMDEMARVTGHALANMKEVGEKPWHFLKNSRTSVVGPGAKVKLPVYSRAVDWEIELAAVIGKAARNVPAAKALSCVAGYTISNDLSARDVMQREKNPPTSPFRMDWVGQKCFDGACPLGPWIVPAEQLGDPQKLDLKLWVNGELMQNSNTSRMIFSTAEQIEMLSSRVTLQPGDLVLTGTPAGVGMGRKLFLKSGDVVKLWIEGIGEMSHSMV